MTLEVWSTGRLPIRSGDQDSRQAFAEQLRASLPQDASRLNSWAWDLTSERRLYFHSSVLIAERALELEPEKHYIQDTLARAELSAGLYDRSIEHYRALANIDFTAAEFWLALALAVRSGPGDTEEAIEALNRYFKVEILAPKKENLADSGP